MRVHDKELSSINVGPFLFSEKNKLEWPSLVKLAFCNIVIGCGSHMKRKGSVSAEATLGLDCNDLNSDSLCASDHMIR